MTIIQVVAENLNLNSISPICFWKLEAEPFDPGDILLSRTGKPSVGNVVFRGITMCYFVFGFIFSILANGNRNYHFQYLTNLTFTLQMIYSLLYFLRLIWVMIERRNIQEKLSTLSDSNEKQQMHLPWPEKILYALASVTLVVPYLITFVYWIFIHAEHKKHYNDKEAISTYFVHALNTVFALVDIWLNAIPFRISSIIFPGIYGLIYGIFTGLYEACGGSYRHQSSTDKRGDKETYIYAFLNWRKYPGVAVGCLIAAILAGMLGHVGLLWGLSRIRVMVYNLCCRARRDRIITAAHEPENFEEYSYESSFENNPSGEQTVTEVSEPEVIIDSSGN